MGEGCDEEGTEAAKRARRPSKDTQRRPALALEEEGWMGVSGGSVLSAVDPAGTQQTLVQRAILPQNAMDILLTVQ